MSDEQVRRIMQDNLVPGLSLDEKAKVRTAQRRVMAALEQGGTSPILAYIALLNVLGSLIGQFLVEDKDIRIAEAQRLLPLYVEAYRVREKKL